MKKLRTGVLALTIGLTPMFLLAQRGPEPQQGTGQNSPDMEHETPSGKSDQPNTASPAAPQSPGQESPDTQQSKHGKKKQKKDGGAKEHGGSHDQASPQ